jgi:hypothetical protein
MRRPLAATLIALGLACSGSPTAPVGPSTAPVATSTAPQGPSTAPVATSGDDPVAVVRPMYEGYVGAGPSTAWPPRALLSTAFLAALDAQAREPNPTGIPFPGFDPVVDAQDDEIADLRYEPHTTGDTALVDVRFTNFGQPETVTWVLVRESGAWKVDDLRTAKWDLRASLAAHRYP